MTDRATLETLIAARVVEHAAEGLQLGDQAGLLDPAKVEALGQLVTARLPSGISALVVGDTRLDTLLGFVVARARSLPQALMYDREGVGNLHGALARGAQACFVTGVLQDSWRIDEFEGLCRQHEVEPAGVIALVSTAGVADGRVNTLMEL